MESLEQRDMAESSEHRLECSMQQELIAKRTSSYRCFLEQTDRFLEA
jgi:hypothetical protein